ncbi:MAG: adenylate/guanylate cyclase domain-containing protein [Coleofasciculus sp. G1-WW12-02]|uniref:CHASE2 domain-containing protein n=1 Tax=Coleofasciculus sp. G1-WW12-02 TaxID=3068483 RepID=UPI0032FA69B9
MWASLRKQLWQWRGVFIAAPSVAGVVIGLWWAGWLQELELAALDQFFRWRPAEAMDSRIVIVEINEQDIQKLGNWPLSDQRLAQLLTILKQQQPRAIGLDLYRDLPVEPGYQELVKVFQSTPNLIGIRKVAGDAEGTAVNPPPILDKLNQIGANDLVVDSDGKVRRGLLSLGTPSGEIIPSFSTMLALTYLEAEGITLEEVDAEGNQYQLGKAVFTRLNQHDGGYVRTDAGGFQIVSNFRNLRQGFQSISITEVLEGKIPKDWGRDRVILIGITGESVADNFFTPYSRGLLGRSPGVEIHADVVSQMVSAALEGRPLIRVWSELWEILWIVVWTVVGATLTWGQRYRGGVTARSPFKVVSLSFVGGGLVGGCYWAFLNGWWIPVVPPILGLTGSAIAIMGYLAYNAGQMRRIFGRYVNDAVVANLLETPQGLRLGGENRQVTILFSDLRGFSAISERVSPETGVTVINHYLEVMTDVIDQYQGVITEIMGDGILVIFGAPIGREDDCQRAIACGIAMQLAMADVNQYNETLNLPALEMGIGIHGGEVLAGNIGSQKRAKYTVLGSPVNLASRIESYTVGGQVFISQDLFKQVDSILRVDGQFPVHPKGFAEPITVYEVGGIGGTFNLLLPKPEADFVVLQQKIPIQYIVLKGKHLEEIVCQGEIVKLSTHGAEIRTQQSLELFSNLKINLVTGTKKAKGLRDIYAKVVEELVDSPTHFGIRFTGIPPEIAALLSYLRQFPSD